MVNKPSEPPFGRTIIHQPRRRSVYCVNDKNGQPVQSSNPVSFLRPDKSTARYYAIPSKPKQYLGNEIDAAIWRFRSWSRKHRGERVNSQELGPPSHAARESWRQLAETGETSKVPAYYQELLDVTEVTHCGTVPLSDVPGGRAAR